MKKEQEKSSVKETTNKEKNKKQYLSSSSSKKSKNKENIFKRITNYFKGVMLETKRIRWTDKKDLIKYSICTVLLVFLLGVYFYGIDWIVLLIRGLAK